MCRLLLKQEQPARRLTQCERPSLVPTVVRAVAAVEGVVRVVNRLGYEIDDLAPVIPEGLARPVG